MASARRSNPKRVFIDSSILMAAAISRQGHARDLIMAGIHGDLELALSLLVLQETERNILNKVPSAWGDFKLLTEMLPALMVNPTKLQVERVATLIVVKDAPIVTAAVRARAAFLASYDRRHLLAQAAPIKKRFGLIAATPEEILRAVRGSAEPAQ
jgi:predicted nucleic acid-binding protein